MSDDEQLRHEVAAVLGIPVRHVHIGWNPVCGRVIRIANYDRA
jgi:hypothetical protein